MDVAVERQFELSWDMWDDLVPSAVRWVTEAEPPAILVVDDDPLFGEIFVEYARKQGHFATYYTNLRELGSLSTLQHYHAALVDYDLGPDLDGLRIAEIFKSYDAEFPVVLTTATSEGQKFCFAKSDQVEGFVRKQDGLDSILNQVVACAKRPLY